MPKLNSGMAIDKVERQNTPATMLQIQNVQKSVLSESIFEDPMIEDKDSSTIHSGQFMKSRVHEEKDDDDDEEAPIFSDDVKDLSSSMGYDFVQANKETSQTYNFGPKSTQTLSIDASLTKLFECMTLAYSGKITSPKWKPFRGMHLTVKDKVRLNNIIWREWHMQYIFMRRPIVCQFATPLSDYIHTKPEAVVLEGKYWKRRLDTVTKEYKKWRRYYRDRILQAMPGAIFQPFFHDQAEALSEWELLERVKEVHVMPLNVQQSSTDLSLLNVDLMDMDFTDNLFSSLNQPFAFPNPKELGGFSCADLIQPGLVQLQPNLEDFMDIDSIQELLAVSKPGNSITTFTAHSTGQLWHGFGTPIDVHQSQNSPSPSVLGLLDSNLFSNNSGNTAGINMLTALAALTSHTGSNTTTNSNGNRLNSGATNSGSLFSVDPQMIIDDSLRISHKRPSFTTSTGQQHGHFLASFGSVPESAEPSVKHSSQSMAVLSLHKRLPSSTINLTGLTQCTTSVTSITSTPKVEHSAASSTTVGHGYSSPQPRFSKGEAKGSTNTGILTGAADVGSGHSVLTGKGCFAVPLGKPVTTPRKPRSIAPAPPLATQQHQTPAASLSSPSSQSTYLAQLLTKGTYPGALINVKKEPAVSSATSSNSGYTPILPAPSAGSRRQQHSPTPNTITPQMTASTTTLKTELAVDISKTGVDFPTSVLLAAASTVLGTSSSDLKDALSLKPFTAVMASGLDASTTKKVSSKKNCVPMVLSSPAMSSPSSPSSAAFSEVLSPTTSPSCINMVSVQLSPPFLSRDDSNSLGGIRLGIHTEQRRQAHLSAEQKRRCNLKSGFDLLHTLVPSLAHNPKVSKATMLQKTAEHCRKMKGERAQMQHEAAILKQEIESLNNAISIVQSQLPETGVPVTRQRVDQMKEMFEEYVRNRTLQNWKFWIFSIVMRSLFDSYSNMVSTASVDELCRSAAAWLDQHCSLISLRPTVLNALRHLSMSTSILTEPQRVQEQATEAVTKGKNGKCSKPGSTSGR